MSAKRRFLYHPLTRIIAGIVICLLVPMGIKVFVSRPILDSTGLAEETARDIQGVITVIIVLVTYYILFGFYEKRKIFELSTTKIMREIIPGFFAGVCIITVVIFALYIPGYYKVLSVNHITVVFHPLFVLIIVGVLEEVFFRGIIYRIVEESLGTNLALVMSSLLFGFVHLQNENATFFSGVAIALELGIILGAAFSLTRRLWLPISLHVGWNFAFVFYGATVSGIGEFTGYLDARLDGPAYLTGGEFGPENSVVTVIFSVLVFITIYYMTWRKGNIRKPYWRRIVSATDDQGSEEA
jgi:membrane protease YdiL (CAAX protease family)